MQLAKPQNTVDCRPNYNSISFISSQPTTLLNKRYCSPEQVISQLWSVTCHMGSHSVTSHPTQVNTPRLNPSQTGWYSIYLPRRDERLSWPRWLGTHKDGLPVSRQSLIQVVTNRGRCGETTTTPSSHPCKIVNCKISIAEMLLNMHSNVQTMFTERFVKCYLKITKSSQETAQVTSVMNGRMTTVYWYSMQT